MTEREPTAREIEAAAKVLCWYNGIAECFEHCKSADGCAYGTRDYGDAARDALRAAFAASAGEAASKEGSDG